MTSPAKAQSSLSHWQHRPARHPRPLHRAHLPHRPVADHHPAGVDAEVPGQPLHPRGEPGDRLGDLRVRARPVFSRPHLLRPPVPLLGRVAQRPARVPQRHPRPVCDHVRHLGRLVPAVLAVDVLDHLLAAAMLDVQVDVRRPVPAGRQEPLEKQFMQNGIDAGDPQCVTDGRVRRGTTPLAEDSRLFAEPDNVVNDQEVTGEPQVLDHLELAGDLGVGALDPLGVRRAITMCRLPGRPARTARSSRCDGPGRGSRAASARSRRNRTRSRGPAGPCCPGRRGNGAAGAPSPHPTCRYAAPEAASQPSISSRLRRARTAPSASASRASPGAGVMHVAGGDRRRCRWPGPAGTGRRCGRRRRAGRGWSARSRRCRGRRRPGAFEVPARPRPGRAAASAARTAPLRQPVRITQCPPWAWARSPRS